MYTATICPYLTSSICDYLLVSPGLIMLAPFNKNFRAPVSATNLGYKLGQECTVLNVGIT